MAEAAAGHSSLGIPKKVGQEFIAADKGGKLPVRAADKRYAAKAKTKAEAGPSRASKRYS